MTRHVLNRFCVRSIEKMRDMGTPLLLMMACNSKCVLRKDSGLMLLVIGGAWKIPVTPFPATPEDCDARAVEIVSHIADVILGKKEIPANEITGVSQ